MSVSTEFLEQVRLRLTLSEYIGRKIHLKKAGREMVGLCPFHNEKSPSFYVNDEKAVFLCRGCGSTGDVFSFVMQIENLGFLDACEHLSRMAGIEVPHAQPEDRERATRLKLLRSAADRAALIFQEHLQSSVGVSARDYLSRRGFSSDIVAKLRIGWAPPEIGDIRTKFRDFDPEILVQAGILRVDQYGQHVSYFRNRVMFPICDRWGNVVAFGGRVLTDAKPKYLNTPETPIYHKGGVLYNYSGARSVAAANQKVIVVEGYTDTIAMLQHGWGGTVAPCGTALSAEQLTEVWKIAAEPILCFNGDQAGRMATQRAISTALPMLAPGRSLQIARLPDGFDCDALMRRNSREAMGEVLGSAVPLAEAIWRMEKASVELTTPERRADLRSRLDQRCGAIVDRVVREQYEEEFRKRLSPRRRRRPPEPPPTGAAKMRHLQQEILLATLFHHPELLDEQVEQINELELVSPELDRVRAVMVGVSVTGICTTSQLQEALLRVELDWAVDRFNSDELHRLAPFTAADAPEKSVRIGWTTIFGAISRTLSRHNIMTMKVPQNVCIDLGGFGTAD